jgi:hypothetical protein
MIAVSVLGDESEHHRSGSGDWARFDSFADRTVSRLENGSIL